MTKTSCLNDLEPGRKGIILKIEGKSPFKKRLLEMGMIKGEIVSKVKLAPLADPGEYIVKGYHISLRKEEARDILIEVID